jgi:hypothetical protein
MTIMNAFDRQFLADILRREGIAAVLSELAWLQVEADLPKLLAEPVRCSALAVKLSG